MTAERLRGRLMRRILLLEVLQDTLGLGQGVCQVGANLFSNLASTVRLAELDAAKQYKALTGQGIREGQDALLVLQPSGDED